MLSILKNIGNWDSMQFKFFLRETTKTYTFTEIDKIFKVETDD